MSDSSFFKSPICPRCTQRTMHDVGDSHYTSTQLVEDLGHSQRKAPDLQAYARACINCGYLEFYSKPLIDRIRREEDRLTSFGLITRSSGGQYLLSINVSYVYKGVPASDFTVPLSAEEWFQLRLLASSPGHEDTLLQLVFKGAYRTAWETRVRKPLDHHLAADIARLVNTYKDQSEAQ